MVCIILSLSNHLNNKYNILWVDDEIEFLKPHILFLKEKGYVCDIATNGQDAISFCREKTYDLILLDEMMTGMGGLEVLKKIKSFKPFIPVVMITKNEEEALMDQAIGQEISNYLIKPISPSQVLSVCKNVLEAKRIKFNYNIQDYIEHFQSLTDQASNNSNMDEWEYIIHQYYSWVLKFDETSSTDQYLQDLVAFSYRDLNKKFTNFIERNYKNWISQSSKERPVLSNDIIKEYVFPDLKNKNKVTFIVMDCLSYDQFLSINETLKNKYKFKIKSCLSIIPSSTLYSRNSIFSGLFPVDLKNVQEDIFREIFFEKKNLNNYEDIFLKDNIKRNNLMSTSSYFKINNYKDGEKLNKSLSDYNNVDLITSVVNFVDMLVHANSSPVLEEIANNEKSYRKTISMWFKNSWLFDFIKQNKDLGRKIIITSDHGSIQVTKPIIIKGDKNTTSGLRYKEGVNIFVSKRDGLLIKDPNDYKLPKEKINSNFIIAKKENFFLYTNSFNLYSNKFLNSFQHGGISIKELFLPIAILEA